MIVGMFAIYDVKVGSFTAPYSVFDEGFAIRAFREVIVRGDSQYSKNPEDFVLYKLGTYDDGTGCIVPLDNPISIISGLQLSKEL